MYDIVSRTEELMEQHNLNCNQLAKAAGIGYATIYDLLNQKKTPSIHTIEKICLVFGISLSEFFSSGINIDSQHLPPDVAIFSLDKDNYGLIRLIQAMKEYGYSNDSIESWLESMYKSLDDIAIKYGVVQGKPQRKVTLGYNAAQKDIDSTDKLQKMIKEGTFNLTEKLNKK